MSKRNLVFCNFVAKLRKHHEISNDMFVLLKKAFELGIKYKEKN